MTSGFSAIYEAMRDLEKNPCAKTLRRSHGLIFSEAAWPDDQSKVTEFDPDNDPNSPEPEIDTD